MDTIHGFPAKFWSQSIVQEQSKEAPSDLLWNVDDIPVDPKNSLDNSTCPSQFVKPPANHLLLLSGDGGELESYLLATTHLYRGFILLDPSDALAVNDFYAGKGNNTAHSGGSARRSSLGKRKNQGTNSNIHPDDHDFDMDNENGGTMDLTDSDDPWKPLNPYEPGKLKGKPFKKENMDRISNLPDELLCHVLSSLTTKEAALTSVLAKRWRYLFAFVPNLLLNDSVFLHPEEGKRERDGVLQSFMGFGDRVLALQGDSPINNVSIRVASGVDSDRVNRWIRNVLQRSVLDLYLCIDLGAVYRLPPEVFVSRTLVKLSVFFGSALDWHALGVSLPMLKELFLISVGFLVDQFELLLPACPALETLLISTLGWMNSNVTVSSASLEDLIIDNSEIGHFVNLKSISFDIPSLDYFDYSDAVAEDYPKVNLTNLNSARINLKLTEDQIKRARAQNIDELENDEDNVFLRFGNVRKFFIGITNVQDLFLSSDTLEVLSLCCESLPVFNNLKSLRIRSEIDKGWQAMPVLLKNSPRLETLALDGLLHFQTDKCGDACVCVSREDKGRSLLSFPVKELKIERFQGTVRELLMIKHFLDSFTSLKRMVILAENPTDLYFAVEELRLDNNCYTCHIRFLVCGQWLLDLKRNSTNDDE